jgi:hypothetical protein
MEAAARIETDALVRPFLTWTLDSSGFPLSPPYKQYADGASEQVKKNWGDLKSRIEGIAEVAGDCLVAYVNRQSGYGVKSINSARDGMAAFLEFGSALSGVKTPSESWDLASNYWREQCEALLAHNREALNLFQTTWEDAAQVISYSVSQRA